MKRKKKLTKKQRKQRKRRLLATLFGLFIFVFGYIIGHQNLSFSQGQDKFGEIKTQIENYLPNFRQIKKKGKIVTSKKTDTDMVSQIHIFDVGQGSSVLLMARDGSTILINTGPSGDSEKKIITHLDREIGLGGKIDLLIFTQNHSNHLGHNNLVLEYFDVQEIWLNEKYYSTEIYSKLLDTISNSNIEYKKPIAGDEFVIDAFAIQVLDSEIGKKQVDSIDEPLVIRIDFDEVSVMVLGNSSKLREKEIIKQAENLKSDILIIDYHGAHTSDAEEWLAAVNPEIAFYQAEKENIAEQPLVDMMQALHSADIPVYGTDEFGTISLYIDRQGQVEIETE